MTGVFIPTEMPQKCYECFYGHDCELVNPYYVEEQRPVDCPLISVELDDVPSDFISRLDAINAICNDWCHHDYDKCEEYEDKFCDGCDDVMILQKLPTADVVEVVRCKDCKHFHDGIYNGEYWMECDEYRIALSSDDWFCADGERREDGVAMDKQVYNRYYDTAGNYHWIGVHSGKHIVRKGEKMIKMTRSLEVFLSRNYPKQFVTISFGHLEDFTDEMKEEYIEWVMTDEGKEYLEGGKHYERREYEPNKKM